MYILTVDLVKLRDYIGFAETRHVILFSFFVCGGGGGLRTFA